MAAKAAVKPIEAPRAMTQCSPEFGCGQWDDHPKHHYGEITRHFDCDPPATKADVTAAADWHPMHAHMVEIYEGSARGLKGMDLLAHIRSTAPTKEAMAAFHAELEATAKAAQ